MAIHAVEHPIYNPIALDKGNWTVTYVVNVSIFQSMG